MCALALPAPPAAANQGTDRVTGGSEPWERHVPTTDHPPHLDGRIEPGEWRTAATVEDFSQVEPREGAEPSERTVVHLMVDRDALYVAIQAYDSDPDGILASQITRDARLDPDDRVELIFDTFYDRRNAYFFQIGPGSSKGDALIANNGSFFQKDWDGLWHGKAVVHEEGWSAELALPAKTLSMKTGNDRWGFNVVRHVKRKNEILQWASPSRRTRLFRISGAGTLTGMAVLDSGLGLDVVPYLSTRNLRESAPDEGSTRLEPGLDLRYKVTPSLTATFTVNTDFAEAEVDGRVVNLSRFPVFFPEKRDFFLEDSGIFSFGGLGNELVPFFSRRIGLSERGEPVPILAGAKLTGRLGRFSLGLLDVVTEDQGTTEGENMTVGRMAVNVLEESQVGALFTVGDPAGGGDNALAGVDFSFRTRSFLGDRNLGLDVFGLTTRDEPAERRGTVGGHAFGLELSYPNDTVQAALALQEISADFRPDLGFVRRRGVRRGSGFFEWQPRPRSGPVRRFGLGFSPEIFWRISDGEIESASYGLQLLEVLFHSGDRVELSATPTEESLATPFEITEGVVIPSGVYRFDRFEVEVGFADTRRLFGEVGWETGTFFSGRRDTWSLDLSFRPLRRLTVGALLEHNDVTLEEGDFTTNLARLRTTVDFTPEISWITLLQWDDTTQSLGTNSRLRWILSPGRDLFFVINRAFDTEDALGDFTLRTAATETTLKLEYTLRF